MEEQKAVTVWQAALAVKRASRGGMLGGSQLTAVAQLLAGGSRLKGSLLQTLRQAEREGAAAKLAPLAAATKVLTTRV